MRCTNGVLVLVLKGPLRRLLINFIIEVTEELLGSTYELYAFTALNFYSKPSWSEQAVQVMYRPCVI